MKKGERIRTHEIAAGRKVSDDHETADVLPIVNNYLYSISMMVKIRLINFKIQIRGKQAVRYRDLA